MISYKRGSELPNPEVRWLDSDGDARDFASGWTFIVRVGTAGQAALIEKTEGVTGLAASADSHNILIEWDTDELDVLEVGSYDVDIEATLTSTGQSITLTFQIEITSGILPAA